MFSNIDAAFLLQLLACIAAGLVIYNQAQQARGKNKAAQPFTIAMAQKFVSQEDHKEHVDQVNERFVTASRSRKEMHKEIEGLKATKAELVAQVKALTDASNLLSSDFRGFRKAVTIDIKEILNRLPR